MCGSSAGNRRRAAGWTGRFGGRATNGAKPFARPPIRPSGIDFLEPVHYRRARQRLPQGRPFFFVFELKGMSDEAHLPAEQPSPRPSARLPSPDGDGRRPQGPERSPRPRPQETQRLATISRRSDFLAANAGLRTATPGFILLVRDRKDSDPGMRVGFTVTKKIGG